MPSASLMLIIALQDQKIIIKLHHHFSSLSSIENTRKRKVRGWEREKGVGRLNLVDDNRLRMPGLTTVCSISRDCLPERVRHLTAFFATLTRLATFSKIVCTIAVIYKDCKLHIYFLHQLNTLLIFWLTYIFNRKVFVYEHTPDI